MRIIRCLSSVAATVPRPAAAAAVRDHLDADSVRSVKTRRANHAEEVEVEGGGQ
jgi:hypothetical protein